MTEPPHPGYGRYIIDAHGRKIARYRATDPAATAFICTCGRPSCTRARLLPFREHIADLHCLLSDLRYETETFVREPDPWGAVAYHLMMAASIDDVVADTGYVEDSMTFALCEPTIDYENGRSEMASKYVAASNIFASIWAAYEAAVATTATSEHVRLLTTGLGERGRRLFESRPQLSARFKGLSDLCGLAEFQCRRGGLMAMRLDRIRQKHPGRDFVFAAELAREFRNHLFHGEDEAPSHPAWGASASVSGARLHRFYTVGRLVLFLIQALALVELEAAGSVFIPAADDENEQGDGENLEHRLTHCQFSERPWTTDRTCG